ncbi:hypothetical protein [Sphaerochaeta pleomorpha]|nr:hypothetical protein [Sphaerochaeta pleomorpha]
MNGKAKDDVGVDGCKPQRRQSRITCFQSARCHCKKSTLISE